MPGTWYIVQVADVVSTGVMLRFLGQKINKYRKSAKEAAVRNHDTAEPPLTTVLEATSTISTPVEHTAARNRPSLPTAE